jgi:hypothetical protein
MCSLLERCSNSYFVELSILLNGPNAGPPKSLPFLLLTGLSVLHMPYSPKQTKDAKSSTLMRVASSRDLNHHVRAVASSRLQRVLPSALSHSLKAWHRKPKDSSMNKVSPYKVP